MYNCAKTHEEICTIWKITVFDKNWGKQQTFDTPRTVFPLQENKGTMSLHLKGQITRFFVSGFFSLISSTSSH